MVQKLFANELPEKGGVSYFAAFGSEIIYYTEKASILPVSSEVTVTNPVLHSGGLYVLNNRWYFSVDNTATLYPGRATESWNIDDGWDITFVDPNSGEETARYDSSDNPVQTNQLTYSIFTTSLLAHLRFTKDIDLISGLRYRGHVFKRFSPETDIPEIEQSWDIVEETVGELMVVAGAGYKSGPLANARLRAESRVFGGVPVWTKIENTNYPGTVFSESSGYDLDVAGHFTFAVTQKFHMGLILQGDGRWRDAQDKQVGNRLVEIPENFTAAYRWGLTLSWEN